MFFSHILVAVGQQPGATFDYGLRLALKSDARLTALHVVDHAPHWALVSGYYFDMHEQVESHAREVLELSARKIRFSGAQGNTSRVELPPWGVTKAAAIARAASTLGADAIVVGGAARGGWWRRSMLSQLGSITPVRVFTANDLRIAN